jgi:ABC-2 type transport system ATP-binding protein
MWAIIRDLVAGGVTIFLTTQHLEEADELADRIAVLDQGKLVAQGTTDQLKALIPGGHVRLQFADATGLESAERALGAAARHDDRLELQVPNDGSVRSLKVLLDRLADQSIEVERFSVHTPDLDDVFLAVTGRPRHEEVAIR